MQSETVKHLYIGSAIAIILVIVLIAQTTFKKKINYSADAKIAIKTSKGLIKMNSQYIADELARLAAELDKHNGFERTGRHYKLIEEVMRNIREFIKRNPKNDLTKRDLQTQIIHKALSDWAHIDSQANGYNTIMDFDSLDHGTDSDRFEYMLKHVDVLIEMLKRDICDDGVIDLVGLEKLLHMLDLDITNSVSGNYETPLGQEIGHKYDPYIIPRLSLFETQQTQIEGMGSRESILKPRSEKRDTILGIQNARNAQQRSQMFRENRQYGIDNYTDEDLLYEPTYEQQAL